MNDANAAEAERLLIGYLAAKGLKVKTCKVTAILHAHIEYECGSYSISNCLAQSPEAFARSAFQSYTDPANRIPWPGDGRS